MSCPFWGLLTDPHDSVSDPLDTRTAGFLPESKEYTFSPFPCSYTLVPPWTFDRSLKLQALICFQGVISMDVALGGGSLRLQ